MKTSISNIILLFFVCFSTTLSAQYIAVEENFTAQQLVENVLINNPCVAVSNITVNGIGVGNGKSFGYFSQNGSAFPFFEGVILSTGLASSAVGPNDSILSEGPTTWLGDADLNKALDISGSINATVLEFDFLPLAGKISFDYIFSSEQYLSNPSPNQCNFTDGFVFLLKEANSTNEYQNLALIPGTDIQVKINTVRGPSENCPEANAAYFGGFNGFEHPTNYNGQTIIMTAEANVTPGVLYHIKLAVADQGNNLYDSAIFLGGGTFKVEKNLGDDRLLASGNPICFDGNLNLDATEPGINNIYEWYRNNVLQTENTATFNVTESGTYKVEVTINGSSCKIPGEIIIEYAPELLPTQATIVQCDEDNDGLTIFNLLKADSQITANDSSLLSPTYYENQNDATPIQNPTAYQTTAPKTIYARVTNTFGCFDFVAVFLEISNNAITSPLPIFTCDGDVTQDGLFQFDLVNQVTPDILYNLPSGLVVEYYDNTSDALSQINAIPNIFENTIPFSQTIWARIVNGSDCYGIVPIPLVVNTFIAPDFDDEVVYLCDGKNKIIGVASGYSSYKWNNDTHSTTREITIDTVRDYNVTVTDSNGCEDTKTFIIQPSVIATITSIDVDDFRGNDNTITVNTSGSGKYEFSLDGNIYQGSSIFYGIGPGEYTVYVNDKNECGTVEQGLFVLDYPSFFTPNNDGFNDTWRIPFLQFYPKSKITIFDRYGKIVYNFSSIGEGWDGNLNSKPLPSNDYWFVIVLENGRTVKGHFALKR